MSPHTEQTIKEEIEARERRRAAFHEAAHLIVLSAFGGLGKARVWPNTSGAIDETAWRGQTQIWAWPGQIPITSEVITKLNVVTPLPERWRVQFGLAGMVAEYMDEGDSDAESIFSRLHDVFEHEVSETDATSMGNDWGIADIASTVTLLKSRWEAVETIAQDLMNSAAE